MYWLACWTVEQVARRWNRVVRIFRVIAVVNMLTIIITIIIGYHINAGCLELCT